MKQLGVRPGTKLEGLVEFQKQGWALVDATYEPVDGRVGRDMTTKNTPLRPGV